MLSILWLTTHRVQETPIRSVELVYLTVGYGLPGISRRFLAYPPQPALAPTKLEQSSRPPHPSHLPIGRKAFLARCRPVEDQAKTWPVTVM